MTKNSKFLKTIVLVVCLMLPLQAAAQSGRVKSGQNKVPVKTVADVSVEKETPVPTKDQTTPPAAQRGNALSDTAKIAILVAVIAAVTVVAVVTREKRVCGPLSGCPLF